MADIRQTAAAVCPHEENSPLPMELGHAGGRIKSLRFSFLTADLNPSTKVLPAWSNPPPGSGLWFLSTLKIRAGVSSGLVGRSRDYCDVRQMFEDLVGRGGQAGHKSSNGLIPGIAQLQWM